MFASNHFLAFQGEGGRHAPGGEGEIPFRGVHHEEVSLCTKTRYLLTLFVPTENPVGTALVVLRGVLPPGELCCV